MTISYRFEVIDEKLLNITIRSDKMTTEDFCTICRNLLMPHFLTTKAFIIRHTTQSIFHSSYWSLSNMLDDVRGLHNVLKKSYLIWPCSMYYPIEFAILARDFDAACASQRNGGRSFCIWIWLYTHIRAHCSIQFIVHSQEIILLKFIQEAVKCTMVYSLPYPILYP